nr:MAG TPA: hypothetical protein [Caudoviricetes sp.]
MVKEKSWPYCITYRGMTNDLHTFCNGSALELTKRYRVASIMKQNGFWGIINIQA